MINFLPKEKMPDWLVNIKPDKTLPPEFPLNEILNNSLYDPSSGLDGDPIKYLSGNIYSFIYIDYGIDSDELDSNLDNPGFKGYHLLLSRRISEQELTPNGWVASPPSREDGNPTQYRKWIKKPFANWSVFEREEGLDKEHGPEKFSLLFLCADGVSAFQALYLSNNCYPKAVAIIQPGTGFGMNWTDFGNPDKIFSKTVLTNPHGVPKYLLYGGIGKDYCYSESCWPVFSENCGFLRKSYGGRIGIWQRN